MGYADIDGKIKAGYVPDREQRKGMSQHINLHPIRWHPVAEYFDNAEKGERFMGQSMADEQDRQT